MAAKKRPSSLGRGLDALLGGGDAPASSDAEGELRDLPILAIQPGHLLGYVVLGTTARWAKDEAALAKAYRDFLAHYDAEMKANRPEYGEHRGSIDGFRREAQEAGPGARAGS